MAIAPASVYTEYESAQIQESGRRHFRLGTLVIYLGVIAGIYHLGYQYIPELWRWIAVKLNLS